MRHGCRGGDVEECGDGLETRAEQRLAVAEQLILRWRPSAGAGSRAWDAEAICGNRGLLSGLDDILLLKAIHAFPVASPSRSRMYSTLGVAMSRLIEEFLLLRVWEASGLPDLPGHRFSASASASLAFPRDSMSTTTEELSLCTSTSYASGGSQWSQPDRVDICVDDTFLDERYLTYPESLPVLHEIALRVVCAGYTAELLRAFDKAPCDVLDRLLSILQVQHYSLEAERISFEDAEWWTLDDMIQRWVVATKLVVKALVVMERQLQAQIRGAFERFRKDYFFAITKQSTFVLLKFADGFTSVQSHEKLIYVLEMYEALSKAASDIVLLFTGAHALVELVSREITVVLANLARASRTAIGGLITKIRTDGSQEESTACSIGVGVHPLTRYVMTCVELLAPHRTALDLILLDGDEHVAGGDHIRRSRCGTNRWLGTQHRGEIHDHLCWRGRSGSGAPLPGEQHKVRAEPRRGRRRGVSARRRVGRAASEPAGVAHGELRRRVLESGRRLPGEGQAGESTDEVQCCVH